MKPTNAQILFTGLGLFITIIVYGGYIREWFVYIRYPEYFDQPEYPIVFLTIGMITIIIGWLFSFKNTK